MQSILNRYSKIDKKFKREFLLLQGKGCIWKKCRFCDYYNDVGEDAFGLNSRVLSMVTGEYGVLDIINSGSVFELDDKTLGLIYKTALEKNIHTIWFEAHWLWHDKIPALKERFKGISLKFRIGAETFDVKTREAWNKGIPAEISAREMAEFFDGCCLLLCVKGQTEQMILNDIKTAEKYFSYCSLNVFEENSTDMKTDHELKKWFCSEIAPLYEDNPKFEILINNTDLGVG